MNSVNSDGYPVLGPIQSQSNGVKKTGDEDATAVNYQRIYGRPQYYRYGSTYYYPDQYYNYYDPFGNKFAYENDCPYRRYDGYGNLVSCSNIP